MAPLPKAAPSLSAAIVSALLNAPKRAMNGISSGNYPVHFLSPLGSAAATTLSTYTQTPPELAVHHILTLAAMATQRLASLRLPTGQLRPASAYFVTLLGTAENRAAVDALTVDAIRQWEHTFARQDPRPPQRPHLFLDPPRPGAYDRYGRFTRASGLFARHSHDIVQPMYRRRQEAASLLALWEGQGGKPPPVASITPAPSPRLSLHLVTTPRAGRAFLADADLADSGLLSRMLVAAPASRLGARVWSAADTDEPPAAYTALKDRLCALYAQPFTAHERVLTFTPDAARLWLAFAQETETALGEGGAYAPIAPFAALLAEHAARLAAIVALIEEPGLAQLTPAHIENGIGLARYYAAEALRLAQLAPPALSDAEKTDLLRHWLEQSKPGADISLRDVCRAGPTALRDADVAYKFMRRMERLGVVQPASRTAQAPGAPRRTGSSYRWHVGASVVSQDVA